jgi:DnaJ-class molecular chaperone
VPKFVYKTKNTQELIDLLCKKYGIAQTLETERKDKLLKINNELPKEEQFVGYEEKTCTTCKGKGHKLQDVRVTCYGGCPYVGVCNPDHCDGEETVTRKIKCKKCNGKGKIFVKSEKSVR